MSPHLQDACHGVADQTFIKSPISPLYKKGAGRRTGGFSPFTPNFRGSTEGHFTPPVSSPSRSLGPSP